MSKPKVFNATQLLLVGQFVLLGIGPESLLGNKGISDELDGFKNP
jgi:hypothetical protein